jgi:hypothetical protein
MQPLVLWEIVNSGKGAHGSPNPITTRETSCQLFHPLRSEVPGGGGDE